TRKSGHLNFDRPCDEPFRLLRRKCSNFGIDLHLDASDVRDRVDGEADSRPETDSNQRECREQNKRALPQRQFEDLVDHRFSSESKRVAVSCSSCWRASIAAACAAVNASIESRYCFCNSVQVESGTAPSP